MSSDESDDESLAFLAASKRIKVEEDELLNKGNEDPSTKKVKATKKTDRKLNVGAPNVIERPADVWLYLKDLKPSGPYSCLLCDDWFINRSKMILHYAVNHKKDFCGICRYFVPNRQAWYAHEKFHSPWPCSQCVETFTSELMLREHLNSAHNLVHCRLCHFRVSADFNYNSHLFEKHNVTNVSSKNEDVLWKVEGGTFQCLLCSKSENTLSTFFGHFMGIHHLTLKCLTSVIAGRDTPFTVKGADVSEKFINEQLKSHVRLGYVDWETKDDKTMNEFKKEKDLENSLTKVEQSASVREIKEEVISDEEELVEKENEVNQKDEPSSSYYKWAEDFDITYMEIIIVHKSYYDYVDTSLRDINSNLMPEKSYLNYERMKAEIYMDVECGFCKTNFDTAQSFVEHMNKIHSVKSVPLYSCRVCCETFDNYLDLCTHVTEELADFEDLWICQFCDKEFDNREETRHHLTEHWTALDYDNCFSPHLGFKCKYCPTLFWNEPDRETHQLRVHLDKYKHQFYKCEKCDMEFGDKVWYVYHHLENHQNPNAVTNYILKCNICCSVMATIEEMRNHFARNHLEFKKVYCNIDPCCYKPLNHQRSLKIHIKMAHRITDLPKTPRVPKTKKKVSCNMCNRKFNNARACSTHMAQVHGPGKFKCKLCREVLQTADERKLHYLLCHPGRHPFECTECGKSFQYKSSLYMHKQEHMPNKQSYTCSYCSKVFAKKDSYREHVQIHEGPRHACSYCPMRFVQRSNMLRHERRHTGERPYRCPHCTRTFADKGACTSHARTHSKDSSYACVYCGQTFVQKSKLTYHIRKHTGENLESCSVCSKLFTSACSLREHMKIHVEKKKIVKCPLCDKGYQDERYMLRHLRTLHSRSQFSCPLCHKLLSSAAGLRHHVITHSCVNTFQCKSCTKSYAVKRTMLKHLRKRHGLTGNELNIKDYYTRLEPRECQLDLDETTMTSIFGPPKKKSTDILFGDFVTLAKKINGPEEKKRDGDSSSDEPVTRIKQEVQNQTEIEIEPTDFVSVKIESVDAGYTE
ncbi:zinc finger protein 107 [Danaus plexippus plexippus]|uniref:Zinc finger protein 107 n=1 Tax=Danaus plexippus plexippus TaxID=278856 RepID=A0A212ENI2_DANPL|nr:zinc finger protein 107 [Danaus plexippus plexippus]